MKRLLKDICARLGIEYVGIAPPGPYEELAGILRQAVNADGLPRFSENDIAEKTNPKAVMPDVKSVIVCIFPYYTACSSPSNISMHAWGRDYHIVLNEMLGEIGRELARHIEGFKFMLFADTGPLVDRYLAYLAGLGYYGRNNFIINEKYGSYVFIGYMLNNYPFHPDKPLDMTCLGCGKCIDSCPGEALSPKNGRGLIEQKCVSYITQKKGALTERERQLLLKTGMVYGCDVCQQVCPHNDKVAISPIVDFTRNVKHTIGFEDLRMSNREFQRKFKERAFAWRGRKPLERNLRICCSLEENDD